MTENQSLLKNGLEMTLRKESTADLEAITNVTIAAFKDHPISQQTEQFIIHALRGAGALAVSLVAEIDGRVGMYRDMQAGNPVFDRKVQIPVFEYSGSRGQTHQPHRHQRTPEAPQD